MKHKSKDLAKFIKELKKRGCEIRDMKGKFFVLSPCGNFQYLVHESDKAIHDLRRSVAKWGI